MIKRIVEGAVCDVIIGVGCGLGAYLGYVFGEKMKQQIWSIHEKLKNRKQN